MAITDIIPPGPIMPMVDYEATKAIIEAKTIEVCRVATVARLREIENKIRTNLKTLHDRIPGDISFWPKEMKEERLILRGQWSCIGRLIDYCSRPARYEAMVRRSKDA